MKMMAIEAHRYYDFSFCYDLLFLINQKIKEETKSAVDIFGPKRQREDAAAVGQAPGNLFFMILSC